MKIGTNKGKLFSVSASALGKKIWGHVKPFLKKTLQKVIVWLHNVVNKLEIYLLEKIDEVEIVIETEL